MIQSGVGNEVKKPSGPSRLDRFKIDVKRKLGINVLLCDSCKWNWRSSCNRPERPNAAWCPDYSRKGK